MHELVSECKLSQGAPELIGQHFGASSMLISYPEGGSIGRFNPPQGMSYEPPKNSVSNILRFFELHCRDWVEVERDRCSYEFALDTNNLWEFRRKPTTKQLRDLDRKIKNNTSG